MIDAIIIIGICFIAWGLVEVSNDQVKIINKQEEIMDKINEIRRIIGKK